MERSRCCTCWRDRSVDHSRQGFSHTWHAHTRASILLSAVGTPHVHRLTETDMQGPWAEDHSASQPSGTAQKHLRGCRPAAAHTTHRLWSKDASRSGQHAPPSLDNPLPAHVSRHSSTASLRATSTSCYRAPGAEPDAAHRSMLRPVHITSLRASVRASVTLGAHSCCHSPAPCAPSGRCPWPSPSRTGPRPSLPAACCSRSARSQSPPVHATCYHPRAVGVSRVVHWFWKRFARFFGIAAYDRRFPLFLAISTQTGPDFRLCKAVRQQERVTLGQRGKRIISNSGSILVHRKRLILCCCIRPFPFSNGCFQHLLGAVACVNRQVLFLRQQLFVSTSTSSSVRLRFRSMHSLPKKATTGCFWVEWERWTVLMQNHQHSGVQQTCNHTAASLKEAADRQANWTDAAFYPAHHAPWSCWQGL